MGAKGPLADLTSRIIGCAIEVHRVLGPGLLEPLYQRALRLEFHDAGLRYKPEAPFRVSYKERLIGLHRPDFDVDDSVLVEVKAVDTILPIHLAISYSYLKVTGRHVCLLINFHETILKNGIHRLVWFGRP